MSISRVAVVVHWPTDVIVGIGVGVFAAWLILSNRVRNKVSYPVCTSLIRFEKWLMWKMFGYDAEEHHQSRSKKTDA